MGDFLIFINFLTKSKRICPPRLCAAILGGMSAGNYNILAEQFASFSLPITWTDQNNNPINLTGFTADMQVRVPSPTTIPQGGGLIVELSTANGLIALGGAAGTITLSIGATQMGTLPPGLYEYDLLLTSSGGVNTRLLQGTFTIAAGVTP